MKVSVVVPAYNAEKNIELCLDALIWQSYPQNLYEVIVVDDGSTDRTAQLAGQYDISLISQNNQGPATARNKGAAHSTGEIVLFTDSDCIPSVNWIEEMAAPFKHEEIAAVKGAYKTDQQEIVARFAQLEFEERFSLLEKAGYTDMVDTYAAGFRRHIFEKFEGFDTRFPVANNEDTELSYRMVAANLKMVFNPKAIVHHLGHPRSLKCYAQLKFSRGYWRMVVYKKFPKKMMYDTYTPKSLKIQIASLFVLVCTLPLFWFFAVMGTVLFSGAAGIFLWSITPFTFVAVQKDFIVGVCTPFMLFVRAVAVGLGALWGMAKGRL